MTNTDKRITQEPEINTQFSHLIQLVWIAQSTRLVMLWITFMIAVVIAETREPKDEQFFINHIFQKYGDREVLTFEVREIKNKWRIGTKGEIGDDGDLNSYGLVIPSAFLAFIVGFPDVGEASKVGWDVLLHLGIKIKLLFFILHNNRLNFATAAAVEHQTDETSARILPVFRHDCLSFSNQNLYS